MLSAPRLVRWSKLIGALAVLAGIGAAIFAIAGDAPHARRAIVVALALGGTSLIASGIAIIRALRRSSQDRP